MTESLKIIQVHSADEGGGAETVVGLHHRELGRQGYSPHLLVARKTTDQANVTQIPFLRGPKGFLRTARWLERTTGLQNLYSPAFRRIEDHFPFIPDVLHFHSLHGIESFAELNVLQQVSQRFPTVITMHDLWLMTGHCGHPLECQRWKTGCGKCPDLTLYPPISRDATAWNFRRKQQTFAKCKLSLIVPSQWLKTQVQASPILSQFPVTVIHNPVDIQTFCPGDASAARNRHNIAVSDRVVLMVAQHLTNPYKGISEGIEAINSLDVTNLKVMLVGHSAKEVASRIHAPAVVLPVTSNSSQLAEYFRAADVLLMPSRGETFGLVAAEAMSCGIPVVAPAVGGLVDVLGNNQGGILTAERNSSEMAQAIATLLMNDERRQLCSVVARKRAVDLFRQELHTQKCLAVYAEAIDSFHAHYSP